MSAPRPWQQVPCIALQPSGALTIDFRQPGEEAARWLEFQKRRNGQAALFVSDRLEHLGGFVDAGEAVKKLLEGGYTPGSIKAPARYV